MTYSFRSCVSRALNPSVRASVARARRLVFRSIVAAIKPERTLRENGRSEGGSSFTIFSKFHPRASVASTIVSDIAAFVVA